jgi:FkbM family methyltransferase
MFRSEAKAILEHITPRLLYKYQLRAQRDAEPEINLLPTLCRPDAQSIDIGANIGLYSYFLLPHSSAVLAFEPLPQMQKRLRRMLGDRITIYPVALSDRDGECEIRLPRGWPYWATIEPINPLALAAHKPVERITVPTRRLDSYELIGIGFIKIDVEGHEEAVLRGSLQTIVRNRPTIVIEIEEQHNPGSINRVRALLESLSYHGCFFSDGEMRRIQEFDLERDQPAVNVRLAGKIGRYINNFIFMSDGCSVRSTSS